MSKLPWSTWTCLVNLQLAGAPCTLGIRAIQLEIIRVRMFYRADSDGRSLAVGVFKVSDALAGIFRFDQCLTFEVIYHTVFGGLST